jgi:hypothetical protein
MSKEDPKPTQPTSRLINLSGKCSIKVVKPKPSEDKKKA